MNQNSQSKTVEQVVEAIFALDLDPIKFKLMNKTEGHGWTRAEADQYELGYRQFLALLVKFPDEVIAPDTEVDKFWHGHILDTMKYAEDCNHVFGYFLHHFPYFGLRGEEDAANLAQAAINMQRLSRQEFGDAKARDVSYCTATAGKTVGKPAQTAAYCTAAVGKTVGKPVQTAAYCTAAVGKTVGKPAQTAAYCTAAVGKTIGRPDQTAAYCTAAVGKTIGRPDQTAAYCTAAVGKTIGKPAQTAAYCTAVVGKRVEKLDQTTAY